MTTKTLQIFIAINQKGEFVTGEMVDEVIGDLQDNYECGAIRTIALNVTLDLPTIETVPVTLSAQEQAPAVVTVS